MLAVVSACGGMDETYKDFIGDKPIVYLARNESDSIKVQNGRERVRMTIPPTMDPRIEYVKVTWNNGMYEKKVPVVYKEPTVFIIDENCRKECTTLSSLIIRKMACILFQHRQQVKPTEQPMKVICGIVISRR